MSVEKKSNLYLPQGKKLKHADLLNQWSQSCLFPQFCSYGRCLFACNVDRLAGHFVHFVPFQWVCTFDLNSYHYRNHKHLLPLAHTREDLALLLLKVHVEGLIFSLHKYYGRFMWRAFISSFSFGEELSTSLSFFKLNCILFGATLWSLRPTLANMKSDVSQSKDTRYNSITQTQCNAHL